MPSVVSCKKFTGNMSSSSGSSPAATEAASKLSRLRLRVWLQREADSGSIPGLTWLDSSKTELRIPWLHGSKQTWSLHDVALFQRWAEHTGRYSGESVCPKRWKANFRCALKSLNDVIELPCCGQTKGKDAYRVYKFLPLHSLPGRRQGAARKRLTSLVGHICHNRRRTVSSSNSVTESLPTSSCMSPTHTTQDSEGYCSGADEDFEDCATDSETSNAFDQVVDEINNEDDNDAESLFDFDTTFNNSCSGGIEENVFGFTSDFGPIDTSNNKQCTNVTVVNGKRDVPFQCLQQNYLDYSELNMFVRDHDYATAVGKPVEDHGDFMKLSDDFKIFDDNCFALPSLELSLGLGELNDIYLQEDSFRM